MFYFTREKMAGISPEILEKAIRSFSSKRQGVLDYKSTSTLIKEDNYFLGVERESDIEFTRWRTSFERLFPKLILSVSSDGAFPGYKIRYSLLSSALLVVVIVPFLSNLSSGDRMSMYDAAPLLMVAGWFLVFTWLEKLIVKRLVLKAVGRIMQADEKLNISIR